MTNEATIVYIVIALLVMTGALLLFPSIFRNKMEEIVKELIKRGKIKVTSKGEVKFS